MSTDDIDELPAGPELDRAVCEQVMGWRPVTDAQGYRWVPTRHFGNFRPSSNWADMAEVLNVLPPEVSVWRDSNDWSCRIEWGYASAGRSDGDGYTIPLAVCRAALKWARSCVAG